MHDELFLRLCDRLRIGETCWEANFAKIKGYNVITYQRKTWKLHVLLYEVMVGPVPAGMVLDHLCSNPGCVRPDHLEPVTPRENILRGRSRQAENARRTHCVNGHPFDEQNTYWRKDKHGRVCRSCGTESMRRQRARKRGAA